MPSEIGAGIAGVGFIGAAHARAVERVGGRLVSVTTSALERARESPADLNADRAFLRPEALTTYEQVDLVHIGNPNLLPLPLSLSPFASGKRVIFEKLLAVETGSADQLLWAQTLLSFEKWMFSSELFRNRPHVRWLRIDPVSASVPYVDRVAHAQAKDIKLFPQKSRRGRPSVQRALRPLIIQERPTRQRGIK